MGTGSALDRGEFLALSDQKADDWREITRISYTFLGIAGTLFAAGMASSSAWVVVISPLPLLLGVLYMTKNARLQLQMITYLAAFSPFEGRSWERDIVQVRPRFWAEAPKGWLARQAERRLGPWGGPLARHLTNPSAWDMWLAIAALVALAIDVVPLFAHFHDGWWALGGGMALQLLIGYRVLVNIAMVEPERKRWEDLWKRYRDEAAAPASTAAAASSE